MITPINKAVKVESRGQALVNRVLSATLLIPLIAFVVYIGGWPLLVLGLLVGGLAAHEFSNLVRRAGHEPLYWFTLLAVLLMLLDGQMATTGMRLADGTTLARPALSLVILASLTWQLVRHIEAREALTSWAFLFAGTMYIGWLLRYLLLLRGLDAALPDVALPAGLAVSRGALWLGIVVGGTWVCDTTAFFVGSAFGRHKLMPRISPSKSWEGTIGGVAATCLWGAAAGQLMSIGVLAGAGLGISLGVAAVLGDLGESLIKRGAAAKDSSRLIPGHGGLLDRLDSMLFAGVVGYYYLLLLGFAH
ncbi:MAG: phosphatidate cytidylyltransferase [Chloroflexi bacterium]|nr:phosphatidate cytidylyltransferase [Chloroflexota bacterium]